MDLGSDPSWSFLGNSNLWNSQVKLIENSPQFFFFFKLAGRSVFNFLGITIFYRQNKVHVIYWLYAFISVYCSKKKQYHCMFIIWKSWNKTTCTATVTTTVYVSSMSAEYFGIIYFKSPIQKNYIAFKKILAYSF